LLQEYTLKRLSDPNTFRVEILCFCIMPNHWHLLVRQKVDRGISKFLSDAINSLTRYYNILHERSGPFFLPRFKSVAIRSEEQLIHVSRYIHLNPYSSGIINNFEDLINYPWSSFRGYMQ